MKLYKMSTIVKKTSRIGGVIVSGGNRRKPCTDLRTIRRSPKNSDFTSDMFYEWWHFVTYQTHPAAPPLLIHAEGKYPS